ncbi:MAG: Cytidylate kinase [Gemmatimonadales bacterium]|jgi:cytidylate kinase|nr:Cytidylate kinase [Gemmatimonadales bacterium]
MKRRTSVIAIDGPAASGKSSTAQMVADKLGFLHVDSGSLYRAATAAMLRRDGDASHWTEDAVLDAAKPVDLRAARTSFYPVLDGRSIEEEIRGHDVTRHVSRVAQMPRVREWVNEKVRDAANSRNVVVDGRDMGTVVFPDAELKIFLVADSRERALRRLRQRGTPTSEQLLDDETIRIRERDARDAKQTVAAPDAIIIDTTALTQEEQVAQIVALSKESAE